MWVLLPLRGEAAAAAQSKTNLENETFFFHISNPEFSQFVEREKLDIHYHYFIMFKCSFDRSDRRNNSICVGEKNDE